jgi:hypothetical protein
VDIINGAVLGRQSVPRTAKTNYVAKQEARKVTQAFFNDNNAPRRGEP